MPQSAILLLNDDPVLLTIWEARLKKQQMASPPRVLSYSDPEAALCKLYALPHDPNTTLCAVMTDATMMCPLRGQYNFGGRQHDFSCFGGLVVAAEALQLFPKAPVALVTGDPAFVRERMTESGIMFIKAQQRPRIFDSVKDESGWQEIEKFLLPQRTPAATATQAPAPVRPNDSARQFPPNATEDFKRLIEKLEKYRPH